MDDARSKIEAGAEKVRRVYQTNGSVVTAWALPLLGAAVTLLSDLPATHKTVVICVALLAGAWVFNRSAERAHELTKYAIRNREDEAKVNVELVDSDAG